jgi:uncharacterized membrane protein YgcG
LNPTVFLALLPPLAHAGTSSYDDDFTADQGRWSGGVVADGLLTVTDGSATLPLGTLASFEGSLLLRLADGERLLLSAGDATWTLDYSEGGGITFGDSALPFPTGHYSWTPDDDYVIAPSKEAWDAGSTLHCEVIYDPTTATWFLYWTGAMAPPNYGYRQIGVATSKDAVNWTRYAGNPVLTIDYDRTTIDGIHVHMPTVVQDDKGGWHMYYACYQNDVGNRICHATSADGFAWTPEGMALDQGGDGEFDEGSLRMPDVLIAPDGTWHMLYNGTDPEEHYGPTGWATSPDGWTWTKQGAVTADKARLQGGGMLETVWGVYQWYNIDDYFAESSSDDWDFATWDDHGESLRKGWAWWNDGYIQAPSPALIDTTYHMWFNGYTYTDNIERLGHARSTPVPGTWVELGLRWDGSTLTATQQGVETTVALAAADGLVLSAEGSAELDLVALTYTLQAEPHDDSGSVDSGGDGGGTDGGTADGGSSSGDGGGAADGGSSDSGGDGVESAEDHSGCACGGDTSENWFAFLLLLPLGLARRRG